MDPYPHSDQMSTTAPTIPFVAEGRGQASCWLSSLGADASWGSCHCRAACLCCADDLLHRRTSA